MLIEAAKGGHTTVIQMLIDYPNTLVAGSGALDPNAVAPDGGGGLPPAAHALVPPPEIAERMPPPGGELNNCTATTCVSSPPPQAAVAATNQLDLSRGGGKFFLLGSQLGCLLSWSAEVFFTLFSLRAMFNVGAIQYFFYLL